MIRLQVGCFCQLVLVQLTVDILKFLLGTRLIKIVLTYILLRWLLGSAVQPQKLLKKICWILGGSGLCLLPCQQMILCRARQRVVSTQMLNPLKGRGVKWLHFAIQVKPTLLISDILAEKKILALRAQRHIAQT